MPAKNPRLTITLQPSLAAQLRKLSELTGNSQSALIGDLLEGTGPVFDRMIQVLEAAKSAKESIRGKLADDMEHAQAKMEGALGLVLEGFDEFTGSLLDEAEAVTRRARRKGRRRSAGAFRRARRAAPTPYLTGGQVRPKATKDIAQSRLHVRPKAKKPGQKSGGW